MVGLGRARGARRAPIGWAAVVGKQNSGPTLLAHSSVEVVVVVGVERVVEWGT